MLWRELPQLRKQTVQLNQHSKEIKRLEEQADTLYEQGIINLFRNETSTVELVKQKEIIQELEKSANRINTVGKVLKSLVVKYA